MRAERAETTAGREYSGVASSLLSMIMTPPFRSSMLVRFVATVGMGIKVVVALLLAAGLVAAVDRSNFKKCSESSFCQRNRALQV